MACTLSELMSTLQEIQDAHHVAEVAFTGDTTIDFLESESAESALQAKLLIVELTYLDNTSSPEQAKVIRGQERPKPLALSGNARLQFFF